MMEESTSRLVFTEEGHRNEFGEENMDSILEYIAKGWTVLTRSTQNERDVVKAFQDSKVASAPVLYFPFEFEIPEDLKAHLERSVTLRHLPCKIERIGDLNPDTALEAHGLLYLPHPYVVPGGMFNEMYGWDSYFIMRGLLRQKTEETERLARGMLENFFFQIEHYGGILNANRTYYLSRSQPPFLSSMVMDYVDHRTKNSVLSEEDLQFLRRAEYYIQRELQVWLHPVRTPLAGLSRFHGGSNLPVVEMGHHNTYYDDVAKHSRSLEPSFLREASRSKSEEELTGQDLTEDYFIADRAMRESGFDVSFRFGPYSGATHHYLPVCLNSLLCKAETDLDRIAGILRQTGSDAGSSDNSEALPHWKRQARTRVEAMNQLMWDEEHGMYFDYHIFENRRSTYQYLSTFYPLWVGVATAEQAAKLVSKLPLFEHPGGLACSTLETGAQWDLPFGWAPLQLIAIEGLRRYGFHIEADRLSIKFMRTILINFLKDRTIREKYDVRGCTLDTNITIGYKENVIGFGWTNAVFLDLLEAFPELRPKPSSDFPSSFLFAKSPAAPPPSPVVA